METTLKEIIAKQIWDEFYVFEPSRKRPFKAKVSNVEITANQFPETFQIHSRELREVIPLTMLVKIIVDWNRRFLTTERFWVEVTNIARDRNGEIFYFGVMRNDTLVGSYDSPIGPFSPQHICDIDVEDFLEKHKLTLAA